MLYQDRSVANRAGHNASVLDKKISIFEKALAANPHSEALIVGYLGTCAQHYPPDKVVSLWKQTIAQHVASEGLWKVPAST
jgi:hypothetical protein